MASRARQVKGVDPDKKGYPGPPGWGLGVRLTVSPRKIYIRRRTSKIGNRIETTKTGQHEQGLTSGSVEYAVSVLKWHTVEPQWTHELEKLLVVGREKRSILQDSLKCVLHIRSKVKLETFVNSVLFCFTKGFVLRNTIQWWTAKTIYMQFLKSRAQEPNLQCQTVSKNMLWGWTFNAFKMSGTRGWLIKRPARQQGVNAFFCFSLPLLCVRVRCLSTSILLSFISLSNLNLQSSCHKPNNPCCPLPAMRAIPRTLEVPARVEPAQPLANNSLGSSWGSCLWIRNILKSF